MYGQDNTKNYNLREAIHPSCNNRVATSEEWLQCSQSISAHPSHITGVFQLYLLYSRWMNVCCLSQAAPTIRSCRMAGANNKCQHTDKKKKKEKQTKSASK